MPKVKLTGIGRAVDGEYDFDMDRFTNAELRLIKRESGVRAGEVDEAFMARDNDLLVAFAMVSLDRAGKLYDPSMLWEADAGQISIDLSDLVEDDDDPPAPPPASDARESGPTESGSQNSPETGELHPATSGPSPTGVPG